MKVLLLSTTIYLTEENQLEIRTEYVDPNKIAASIPEYGYPHILSAIIRQALTSAIKLEEETKELIERL